jgi:hypothetical protein
MKYLSTDNKTYEEGSFDNINNFSSIKTDFYQLKTDFNNSGYSGSGKVYNNISVVWYDSKQELYEIEENMSHYFIQIIIFSLLFSLICFGLYLLYKYQNKVQVQIK